MSSTFGMKFKIAQLWGDRDSTNEFEESSIDILPREILYIIMEKLDDDSFVNCLHVSDKWRSIVLSLADVDKTEHRWKCIYEAHIKEESYKSKSCNMSYKELFMNSIRWNLDFSYSLYKSCSVKHVKKINIYRDNIIIIDCEGVKYYDVNSNKIKKILKIYRCIDFIERDSIVVKVTEVETTSNESKNKLFIYGKSHIHDEGFVVGAQVVIEASNSGINYSNTIILTEVNQFMLENDCCYIMSDYHNELACYTWNKKYWDVHNLGRYYGSADDLIYAMNVLNSEIFLLVKSGQMMRYCDDKINFQQLCRINMPVNKNIFVKMVHKYGLVIGVPADCEFRVTRFKSYSMYKMECPNLSCVTQHGEMVFLGFNDGRIEMYMPRARAREDIFKRRINITDFVFGYIEPEDLVVLAIDVFEELGKHYLFIATHCCVYQLEIKHDDETELWEKAHESIVCNKVYPIPVKYPL